MKAAFKLSIAAAAATLAFAVPASAQNLTGTTTGCFYLASAAPCVPGASSTTVGDLTFAGGIFNADASAGFGAIGNAPAGNFGTFSLPATSMPANFFTTPYNFLLYITLTSPTGASPVPIMNTAVIEGVLGTTTGGGVTVNFNNSNLNFSYTGGTGFLRLNDVSLNNNTGATSVPVTGDFRLTASTTVPEPSTYALMAAGLAGLFFAGRRRRQTV